MDTSQGQRNSLLLLNSQNGLNAPDFTQHNSVDTGSLDKTIKPLNHRNWKHGNTSIYL